MRRSVFFMSPGHSGTAFLSQVCKAALPTWSVHHELRPRPLGNLDMAWRIAQPGEGYLETSLDFIRRVVPTASEVIGDSLYVVHILRDPLVNAASYNSCGFVYTLNNETWKTSPHGFFLPGDERHFAWPKKDVSYYRVLWDCFEVHARSFVFGDAIPERRYFLPFRFLNDREQMKNLLSWIAGHSVEVPNLSVFNKNAIVPNRQRTSEDWKLYQQWLESLAQDQRQLAISTLKRIERDGEIVKVS